MDKASVWYALGQRIGGGIKPTDDGAEARGTVPTPETIRVMDHSIHIETFTCADVDAWAFHFGLPKPQQIDRYSYGSVEFFPGEGNFEGANCISVECNKSAELQEMNEERESGEQRESVAAQT